METLLEAFANALRLLWEMDPELRQIVLLTLRVTGTALLLATVMGLPLGVLLGLRQRLPARGCLLPIVYTGMGLPPVVAGLFVYLLLSNQGPLGNLRWLFTPNAMIAAQTVIALPLVIGLTIAAVQSVDPLIHRQVKALGATRWQLAWTILLEARIGVLAAIVAAFGRIVAEVGAVMLVGGNIQTQTRVLTTAIVLETRKGNFALALALGFILMGLAFLLNFTMYHLERRGARR
jgi:tungstate transport system permease protein